MEKKCGGHIVISNIYSLNSFYVIKGIRRSIMLVKGGFFPTCGSTWVCSFPFLNTILLFFINSHFHFTFKFYYTHGILYILDICCFFSVWSLRPISPWSKSYDHLMTSNYSFVMMIIVVLSLYFSVLLFWRTLLTSFTYTFWNLVLRSD